MSQAISAAKPSRLREPGYAESRSVFVSSQPVSKMEPKKMERRRRTISSTACCIRVRTSRLIAFTTDASCAASGGYCWSTRKGGRNCVCHFDGNGTGTNGNVEIGRYGPSEYRGQRRDFSWGKMGKISALPTRTKAMKRALIFNPRFINQYRPNGPSFYA